MNKKILIGVLLLAVCVSIGVISAAEDAGSLDVSGSSNSADGSVQIDNNVVTIEGFKFTIPEGFKENETVKKIGEEADQDSFPGFKESTVVFDKGDERYLITVIFGDVEIDDDSYNAADNAVVKEIADVDGWYEEYDGGAAFDYVEDGKLVHLFAPDEQSLIELIQSSPND